MYTIKIDLKRLEISSSHNIMPRTARSPYQCPACGLTTTRVSNIKKHFYDLQKPCPRVSNDIELTDEIKEYVVKNRVYKVQQLNPTTVENLEKQVQKLNMKLCVVQNKKNEEFYQKVVESYLGGTHKNVETGVTDVTTASTHAEIKNWDSYKDAIGQLTAYNAADPKEKLQVYLFGKASQKQMEKAYSVFQTCNIEMFYFKDSTDEIQIIDYEKKDVVFKFTLE